VIEIFVAHGQRVFLRGPAAVSSFSKNPRVSATRRRSPCYKFVVTERSDNPFSPNWCSC